MFGYSGIVDALIFVSRNELLIARVGDPFTPPRGRVLEKTRTLAEKRRWEVRGESGRAHSRIITRQ